MGIPLECHDNSVFYIGLPGSGLFMGGRIISAVTINNYLPDTMHACIHRNDKKILIFIFLLIHCIQTTENICMVLLEENCVIGINNISTMFILIECKLIEILTFV